MAKNKEKKSFDFKNILVYLCMFFLVLVIVLPPVFRIVFKDLGTTNNSSVNERSTTLTALNCSLQVDNYTVTVISSYEDDVLNKVTVNYVQSAESEDNLVDPNTALTESIPLTNNIEQEIALLRTSPSFIETLEGNSDKFELTKENFDTNEDDEIAKNYYNSKEEQKLMLTEFGYSCQEVSM